MFRKKRLVRVHFREVDSADSIEGILLGVQAGHYRLANARHLVADADASRQVDGEALIPKERVLYVQVIG